MKKVRIALSLILSVMLAVTSASFSAAASAETKDAEIYSFKDRYGEQFTTGTNAFAVEVMSFVQGTPWTSVVNNQDPSVALGLPNYDGKTASLDDLTLGGSGELILRLDVYIYDGPGKDLCVFEAGPNVESTRISVSNDLETWYDVGVSPGSTAGVDLYGKVPANEVFQYVKIIDLRDSASGNTPGADIDALCALNYTLTPEYPTSGPTASPDQIYSFTDRYGNHLSTGIGAFAVEVVSFVNGTPWTSVVNNQDPNVALGLPDYDGKSASLDDLTMGGSGELILRLDVYIYDGPGKDLCVFEAGPNIESTRISVSNDLETWYDVGVCPGSTAGVDLNGKVPANQVFQYVKMIDLRDSASGDTPGADIDALCALNYTTVPEYPTSDPTTSPDQIYTFTDRYGDQLATGINAFAVEVMGFVQGTPWTSILSSQDPDSALGLPDYVSDSETPDADVTLGGSGELILRLDVYFYDGPGKDLCVFEVGPAIESTRIAVSSDLETWYDVGVCPGSTAGVDLNGKVPANSVFRYVKLTDLRDAASGDYPGADIDALCALNYTTTPEYPTSDPTASPDQIYTFTDRYGNQLSTGKNAFAVEVMSFVNGTPWTSIPSGQDPDSALGLPDYVSDSETPDADVTLGGSGELILRLDVYIYDGPGKDLCVFEVGPDIESTRISVSNDLETWYDVGVSPGSTAGVDLNGKVPADSEFRYVKLTDLRDAADGDYPGADIDALCALNYRTAPDQPTPGPSPTPAPTMGPGETYTFTDRSGNERTTNTNAFAVEVMSFVAGYPSAKYAENSDPHVALGLPDYQSATSIPTGDLTLGAGGVLILRLNVYIQDGSGPDLCLFEAGSSRESAKLELSSDMKTWYTVGISSYGTECFDISGKVPENAAFRYVRITDLKDSNSGNWPGADIDALCALNYTLSPAQVTPDPTPTPTAVPSTGETYTFTDRDGNQRETGTNAFAAEAVSFVPGSPWTSSTGSQSPALALGLPDEEDLTLGASGVLTVRLDVYLYDGPGEDLCLFEIGTSRESARIEVSSDLKKWYAVGISYADTEAFDLSGKVPKNTGFRYIRITDLRDVTSGSYPGADIDAVCALNYKLTPIVAMDNPDFILPRDITVIEAEAFAGIDAAVVSLPDGVLRIGDRAFANCPKLRQIYVPASVTQIGENVFQNTGSLTVFGEAGSTIQQYAEQAGIPFIAMERESE